MQLQAANADVHYVCALISLFPGAYSPEDLVRELKDYRKTIHDRSNPAKARTVVLDMLRDGLVDVRRDAGQERMYTRD